MVVIYIGVNSLCQGILNVCPIHWTPYNCHAKLHGAFRLYRRAMVSRHNRIRPGPGHHFKFTFLHDMVIILPLTGSGGSLSLYPIRFPRLVTKHLNEDRLKRGSRYRTRSLLWWSSHLDIGVQKHTLACLNLLDD